MEFLKIQDNNLMEFFYSLQKNESFKDLLVFSNVNALQKELSRDKCCLVVLDAAVYKNSIIEVAERILKRNPNILVVIAADDDGYALSAMQIGVLDYVVSPVSRDRLDMLKDKLKRRLHDSGLCPDKP